MPHPVIDLISALHALMMVLPALLNRAHEPPPLGAVLTPFLQLLLLLQGQPPLSMLAPSSEPTQV